MNQILITEKIYITPELKRKKRAYKINFIISIILIVILCSFYVYAEYDRNKNADLSKDILASLSNEMDTTTINSKDDVWIVALDGSNIDESEEEDLNKLFEEENSEQQYATGTYTASNGKSYSTVGEINIPSIKVNYPILSETTDALLKVSVCKFWGCNPNEVGNLCIAGHNYRNSRFFSKVLNMVVGDTIEITDLSNKTLVYEVYDKFTVDPSDVSCTSQLTSGKKIVTLITCTNDSKQRVVVKAREII